MFTRVLIRCLWFCQRRKVAWVEARDPETGKSYWYHPVTRQTSWTKPAPS